MTPPPRSFEDVRREILARLAEALDLPLATIDPAAPFASYGLGSRDAVVLSGELAEWLGVHVQPTVFYDHPSANALASYISAVSDVVPPPTPASPDDDASIALVGFGCRFPGAHGGPEFLRLLQDGTDAVALMPPSRETLLGEGALEALPPHGRWGAFVEDVDAFDAPFFGIGAAEAASMDPQQRWLLEVAWEALEDAGQAADDLAGSRTGVFVGISTSDYALLRLRREPGELDAYFGTSNSPSVAAGRLAYQFGFQGPTLAVDTACSSSLVAVHLACQSLRLRECDLALAGGVNLMLAPETTAWACRGRILSESGRCRTFDRAADGYVRGEGCGIVVLKRLEDAVADRDRVVAVIRGSAVNHDGRSSGLTAPNGRAQQRVILAALAQARVAPEAVLYLEAHGTGTVLGDPIEIHAAASVYGARRQADRPLVVGSVKTNIGHLEAAAGVAGLIKTALALTQDRIPPHLHLTELNPYIAAEHPPIAIAGQDAMWTAGAPRFAAVSAFGLSGTNAHVVLEEWSGAPSAVPSGDDAVHLLPISARSEAALRACAAAMHDRLCEEPADLAGICYTASARRSHHRHRLAVWGRDARGLADALTDWLDGRPTDALAAGTVPPATDGVDVRAGVPLATATARDLAVRYCEGARVRWDDLYPHAATPVALPRYPFDRHRYWFGRDGASIGERLRLSAAEHHPALLRDHISAAVLRCLDTAEPVAIPADAPLSALGLDSLAAIDLANTITADLGISISAVALLDGMTVDRIVDSVLARRHREAAAEPLPPAARPGAAFPLSQAQERIWILDQLAGAQTAYIIPSAVRVRGPLDVHRLERALAATVVRHAALRTQISVVDGRPLQQVAPAVDTALPVVDLADLPADRRHADALARATDETARPFDLSRAPLFRTTLFRLDREDHLWFVGIHHIIADGTSLAILMRDVLDAYEAGGEPKREKPATDYSQFVAWEQQRIDSDEVKGFEAAARRMLEGARPLNLPTDHPRPADRSFEGSSVPLHVPGAIAGRLRLLARAHDTTLNSVLTAAFQTLLGRLSQQTDVLLGLPLVNRSRAEFESVVGCFANTGVIRTDVSPERRFSDVLRDVHDGVREAWRRQDVPFGRLVKTLGWREPGHNPFFDALFVLNVPTPAATAVGATFEPVFVMTKAAKFDLALFCDDRAEGLDGFIEYRHDLFERGTVERLLRQYVTLLGSVADRPEAALGDLDFFDGDDTRIIRAYADTPATPFADDACLHDLVALRAREAPQAIAAADDTHTITYAALHQRSGDAAEALAQRNIGRGTVVAVAMDRTIDLLVTLLGVLKSGAAYLPLDPSLPADRIRTIVDDAGAVLVDRLPQRLADDAPARQASPSEPEPSLALAYVIYTSGSTGSPKGVEVTHRNIVNLLESMARRPGMGPSDVLLAVTPVTFDIAALELFLPLIVGGRVVIAARDTAADGSRLRAVIASSGATIMQATPATWRMLAAANYRPGPGLKVLCGGEALPADLAAHLTSGGAEVWNMYGPTETTVWSTTTRVRPGEVPALGAPIDNTRIRVLDARRRPVALGSPGEICIGGEGVARGYRNQPRLTAEKFIADPGHTDGSRLYRTGDIGCLRADGTLRFLGRSDDQIKIRGFRVEPAEIEAALAACPGVRQAAVIAHRAADDDVRLVAFVRDDGGEVRSDRYRGELAARLPGYMIPGTYVGLDTFPLTPNGKVDRRRLAAAAADAVSAGPAAYEPPRTPLEQALAVIWAGALGLPQVGVRSSFFELGGHSLLAATVIAQVEAGYRLKLPLNLFYIAPTVEEHARYIEAALAPPPQPMTPDELDRLLTMIESLSDDEAAGYLRGLDAAQQGDEL